jgi:hypothetical protein
MRLCPSVDGSGSPLITHRIGSDVCLARQATNFHKCYRCVYRGQAAAWQPEEDVLARIEAAAEASGDDQRPVVIPRPAAAAQPGAASGEGRAAAANG